MQWCELQKGHSTTVYTQWLWRRLKAETLVRNPRCNPRRGSEPIPECRDCLKGTSSLRSHCGFATLDGKEIKPVSPKGNQSWMFTGRTDAEVEAAILWPPDVKSWLIGKDPDAGKDWRQEEKGTTEDEMVGWHHWLDGHKLEQAPGVGDGQGSLVYCSPCGHKVSDTTEQVNNNSLWGQHVPW